MATKPRTVKGEKPKAEPEIELHEDAWPRFERFIKDAAKAGPKHREPTKPKERPASKGRVRKGKSRT